MASDDTKATRKSRSELNFSPGAAKHDHSAREERSRQCWRSALAFFAARWCPMAQPAAAPTLP